MKKELELKIKEILEKNYYRANESGDYVVDIYADYRDKLEKDSLVDISQSLNARETFYEKIDAGDSYILEADYLVDVIIKDLNGQEFIFELDDVRDWISENVVINLPYNHFLSQRIKVNITVMTGEENVDYTLNNFYEDSAEKRWSINDNSSLLWLSKTQGYGKKVIKSAFNNGFSNAVKNGHTEDNKYLYSLYEEILNTTTHMNQMVIFAEMSLEEFINLREEPQDLRISKTINCGLVDFWSGAGGLLDLKLEKEFTIPAKLLKVDIDGGVGYEVSNIYGLCDSFWKPNKVTISKPNNKI